MQNKESAVEIVEHTQHAVVYPRGYLNGSTGEKIDSACSELMQKGKNRIIINFGLVETINTMGIANLVGVLERIGRRNGAICFSNLGTANRQIFNVLDISRAVLIFDDEGAATRHLADRYGLREETIEEQAKIEADIAGAMEAIEKEESREDLSEGESGKTPDAGDQRNTEVQ